MSYRNEGDGEGTGRAPTPATTSPQQQDQAHPHAGKGSRKGGQFVKKGSGTGGNSGRGTRKTTHPTTKPGAKPAPPNRHRSMHTGDTGSDVADLNAVLSKLGLAHTGDSSTYLPSTEAAVMDAQRRLGLKPTGHASAALIKKLHAAAALSPCIKRSADDTTEPSVTRINITPRVDPDRGGAWAMDDLTRAAMSTMDINDLPDSAFAYVEDGGSHDEHGRTVPRSLRHFPIHDEAHVRAALARMSESPHGDKAAKKIHKAAKRMGIGDYDNETDEPAGPEEPEKMRSQTPSGLEILRYERCWPLEGIEILRGGDGRTVEAYAAIWDTPTEIRDQHGHYIEEIDRASFNRELHRSKPQGSRDYWLTNCFYNHGSDLMGKPNGLLSVPLGSPLDIKPDGKGLLTVTRYNKSELADSVLESIRNGDIRAQSFRGRIYKSTPERVPRSRDGSLPTIRRMELGLSEYGPTPSAFYQGASIVAVRARQMAQSLADLGADERAELIRMLSAGAPLHGDSLAESAASNGELGAEDQPPEALRSAADIARCIRMEQILRSRK